MRIKVYLIVIFLVSLNSCSNKVAKNVIKTKTDSEYLGEPSCIDYTEFKGYSFIYTDKCGCGNKKGFFGSSWNIDCEDERNFQEIRHDFNVGELTKWDSVIDFLQSRKEEEANKLLIKVNQILKSSNFKDKPYEYYNSIKDANEYLEQISSNTFRKAFMNFLEKEFNDN